MSRSFAISTANTAKTNYWKRETLSLDLLLGRLSRHLYRDHKDGPAFVPGALVGQSRNEKAVERIEFLVYDIDGTQSLDAVHQNLITANVTALLYTTYSHLSTTTAIKTDEFKAWAEKTGQAFPPDSREVLIEFCRSMQREHLIDDSFSFDPTERPRQTEKGICYTVTHRALDKLRVVLLLEKPIVLSDLGDTTAEAIAAYKSIYHGVGRALGLVYDGSCEDPSRLFYFPSSPHSGEPMVRVYPSGNEYSDSAANELAASTWLRWDDEAAYPRVLDERTKTRQKGKLDVETRSVGSLIFEGFNLKTWAAQYAAKFDIESVMRDRNLVKGDRAGGGVFVECHEQGHSGGEQETFAKNGDGTTGFVLHCSGHTGGCHQLDRLQHLLGYLQSNVIVLEDLRNPLYQGGEISNRAAKAKGAVTSNKHRVVDRNGVGFDAAMFCKTGVKLLEIAALNARCAGYVQFGGTVSPGELVEHIRAKSLSVEDILACVSPPGTMSGYEKALRELAIKKRSGTLQAEIDKEIGTTSKAHSVNKGAVKEDFSAALDKLEEEYSSMGVLSLEDTAKIVRGIDFSDQFVIANTGGKAVVLNTYEPDLSKAIMSHDDFVKLYREFWYPGLKGVTRYLAQDWAEMPPAEARFYRGGLVFKPISSTRPNISLSQYNLYSGFLIEPDASGSCSLFHDLLHEVWVQGDQRLYEWVLEYFMHPLRFPGDKVRTALAIRGTHGDGKSIVTEKLMAPIYGDMLLRVSNDSMVLGDFNEALAAKLMIVLEEAAFAGNKNAFAKLKELVTGDTMLINPKHKAPITLDNYARMILISNQAHFMDIEPGDRRYTVLNSVPSWKGTKKFEALLEQWNKQGGAARFVHEAMNHEFRRVESGNQLVINTKIKTEHEVKQGAASRLALDKFFVSLLLSGSVSGNLTGSVSEEDWPLDENYKYPALELQAAVSEYFHDYAPSKTSHIPQFHEIYEKLEQFYGKSPQGRFASGEGGRKGASYRLLPKRRDALINAFRENLITRDEFLTAIDSVGVKVTKTTAYAVVAATKNAPS